MLAAADLEVEPPAPDPRMLSCVLLRVGLVAR
jgi:hypothetical protein